MKTKPLNIQSLTWLSDIHLEFLRQRKIDDFAQQVQAHPGKAVLITGDIATGDLLQSVLGTLARNIDRPIVYCLGNHDFYNSSFEKVEQAIAGAGQLFNNLIYLDGKSIIPLTEQTALIGINGWACGTGGIGRGTGIRLTDDTEILDFECLPTDDDRFNLMFQLAKGYAETLRPTLRDALARFQNVIIGIHVPPFLEAAWHMGQISGPQFLPCSLRRPWAACWSRRHRNIQRQSYRSTAVIPIAPAFLRSTTSRFGPQGQSSISFHELRDSLKSNDKEHGAHR